MEQEGKSYSARVLVSFKLENLFTEDQLKQAGVGFEDMVTECFDSVIDMCLNGESFTIEEIDTWQE